MLVVAGALVFGLRIRGSVPALAVMILATTVFLIALSMLCVAVFTTINQLSAAANVGAMILGGLGGGRSGGADHRLSPPPAPPTGHFEDSEASSSTAEASVASSRRWRSSWVSLSLRV